MRRIIAVYLIFLLMGGCNNWNDNLPEELSNAQSPALLDLKMGIEITQLRVDLVRNENYDDKITENQDGQAEYAAAIQDYHHIGFYLDKFVFADLNNHISFSVLRLLGIGEHDDFEVAHRVHGNLGDRTLIVKREGSLVSGIETGAANTQRFEAEYLDHGIFMDHRSLFPYRTFYQHADRISERVQGYFIDLTYVRIRKEGDVFVAPSVLNNRTYSQPQSDKVFLSNKVCKITRNSQFVEFKSSANALVRLYTLPDGFMVLRQNNVARTIKTTENKVEVFDGDLLIETFERIK